MRWSLLFALAHGCEQPCVGVGCEEDFGAARLHIVLGDTLPDSGVLDPTQSSISLQGTEVEGPDWDVAIDQGHIIVGTQSDRSVRTYGLESGQDAKTSEADGQIVGAHDGDAFGARVTTIRDANGDVDLLVSAPLHSVSANSRHDGAVYRFAGMGQGFTGAFDTLNAVLRVTGEESGGRFGSSIAVCPDLDGDGAEEWLSATTRANTEKEMAGSVTLFRSQDLSDAAAQIGMGAVSTTWTGAHTGGLAGHGLSCRDDLDGDGVPDLLISAPYADSPVPQDAVGAVYMLSGADLPQPGALSEQADLVFSGTTANAWLGFSLATGDLNGDGLADVAIGAPGFGEAAGVVRIWMGSVIQGGGIMGTSIRIEGTSPGDGFGRSVAMADTNGDGLDDLLAGAPFVNPTGTQDSFDAGYVRLFFGTETFGDEAATLSSDDADLYFDDPQQYLRTGRRLFVGDFDGDERADVALLQRTAED